MTKWKMVCNDCDEEIPLSCKSEILEWSNCPKCNSDNLSVIKEVYKVKFVDLNKKIKINPGWMQ